MNDIVTIQRHRPAGALLDAVFVIVIQSHLSAPKEPNKTMDRNALGVVVGFCFHGFFSPMASLISAFASE